MYFPETNGAPSGTSDPDAVVSTDTGSTVPGTADRARTDPLGTAPAGVTPTVSKPVNAHATTTMVGFVLRLRRSIFSSPLDPAERPTRTVHSPQRTLALGDRTRHAQRETRCPIEAPAAKIHPDGWC